MPKTLFTYFIAFLIAYLMAKLDPSPLTFGLTAVLFGYVLYHINRLINDIIIKFKATECAADILVELSLLKLGDTYTILPSDHPRGLFEKFTVRRIR